MVTFGNAENHSANYTKLYINLAAVPDVAALKFGQRNAADVDHVEDGLDLHGSEGLERAVGIRMYSPSSSRFKCGIRARSCLIIIGTDERRRKIAGIAPTTHNYAFPAFTHALSHHFATVCRIERLGVPA